MPRVVDMGDLTDPLATSADIFKFESALELKHPAMIAVRGEDTVPYELEDAMRVLVQHHGVGPLTRSVFSIEDVEPLWVQTRPRHRPPRSYTETLDRLLIANLRMSKTCWRVRGLLSAKANPGEEALPIAIQSGNVGAFYALMHAGAACAGGAMRQAVASGNADMVRAVGMQGAVEPSALALTTNVEVLHVLVNELGYIAPALLHPAYRAIEMGLCDVVDFFFENDPSLRVAHRGLMTAALAGQPLVIDLLVGKYGMQPCDMELLCAAARHDQHSSLRALDSLIVDKSWLENQNAEGDRPLMAALRGGAWNAMKALVDMGAEPFEALFELARSNKTEALGQMLSVLPSASVAEARRNDHNVLAWAAIHGSFDCAVLLMRRITALKPTRT